MKSRVAALAALVVLIPFLHEKASATTFTAANLGDSFSGTFTLNPSAPVDAKYSDSTQSIFSQSFAGSSSIGTITAQIGADVFSSPILEVMAIPGTDPTLWHWYLDAFLKFNGADIQGTMDIALYGSSSSLSILPLPFSSYARGDFEIIADTLDSKSGAVYFGHINSLIQTDATANFTFSGTITEGNLWSLDATGHALSTEFTAAVPEPSTWAMMILGFLGLGFIAY